MLKLSFSPSLYINIFEMPVLCSPDPIQYVVDDDMTVLKTYPLFSELYN